MLLPGGPFGSSKAANTVAVSTSCQHAFVVEGALAWSHWDDGRFFPSEKWMQNLVCRVVLRVREGT